MFKFTQSLIKSSKNNNLTQFLLRFGNYSSGPPSLAIKTIENDVNSSNNVETKIESSKSVNTFTSSTKSNNSMIAAAFASLKEESSLGINTPHTDDRVANATSINELLSISEGSGVSRRHALKVVSVLAEWSSAGKIQLSDFETDRRFIKLCKVLTKGVYLGNNNRTNNLSKSEDLTTVLSVTADDEAAKLISSMTLPQMVKVMTSLGSKKRRSTPLLRAVAFNIARVPDNLDIKQCADLLFSMATLNFLDENLLEKIGADICNGLQTNTKKSAVVGSILTSLGLLRYKQCEVLDALSEWITKYHDICRPPDIFALLLTCAVLNHSPINSDELYRTLIPQLNVTEAGQASTWLDIVWSLVLLNQAKTSHISSVLSKEFLLKLEEEKALSTSSKLKLLNINAAAALLIPNYEGPKINNDSGVRNVVIIKSKEKELLVKAVLDTLNSLLHTETYLRTNVNGGMGFLIDAECALDKKCNPLPLNRSAEGTRVAIQVHDYHDMCRGHVEPTGICAFAIKLLEAQGYKVLAVPHSEFNFRDKLVHRVQYLELKLKMLAQCN